MGRGRAGRRAPRVLVGQRRRARHPGRADVDGGGRDRRACASSRHGRSTCSTWSASRFPESAARRSVRRWWRPDHGGRARSSRSRVRRPGRPDAAGAPRSDRRSAQSNGDGARRLSSRSPARRCSSTWARWPTQGCSTASGPGARSATGSRPSRCRTPCRGWPRSVGSGTSDWRRSNASSVEPSTGGLARAQRG